MNWHRDGQGGYVADHGDMDAQATVTRVPRSDGATVWEVVTTVFGSEVDRAAFERLADAKWHASHVASLAAVNAWPR